VLVSSVTLLLDYITTYCHDQLQEAQHISSLFITAGPGTDLAGTDDVKFLSQTDQFFMDHSNSIKYHTCVCIPDDLQLLSLMP